MWVGVPHSSQHLGGKGYTPEPNCGVVPDKEQIPTSR